MLFDPVTITIMVNRSAGLCLDVPGVTGNE